ncbi:MAG: aminotransferase class I/II-fold pyridoxal phosphate-dependent enzyme [Erysipelotrichaceae bacterium]|nr:aminotransferase class I/II-fold pyridoxal phosphate-dependent enzyme [Erysipelotrichaceae bacterium]
MKFAKRMDVFGESIFTTLAKMRYERAQKGLEVIDLSIGAPNIPPHERIVNTLSKETLDRGNYIYAITDLPELQDAVVEWYQRRYGVTLDPRTEVTSMLGSQEGLSHLALTLVDPGDIVLVPNPCYPIFRDGALLAGAKIVDMPLKKENNYVIDLDAIAEDDAKAAKLMIVSYPNNPTCGVAPVEFYEELVKFAKKYDIVVLHDNAYSELLFAGPGHSFLEFEGAKDIGVEFNSLSKTYGMAGARIGFMVGNSEIVSKYKTLKSNMDYGMFIPIQKAAISAIQGDQSIVLDTRNAYRHRRDLLVNGVREIGWDIDLPEGSMFVWAKIPDHYKDSESFTYDLFEKTGVLVVPGNAFGSEGEGFVRMALVQDDDTIKHMIEVMDQSNIFKAK